MSMKAQRYDYSGFRLSRINDPRFRHLWLLLSWVGYLVLYLLTENLIPPERCHVMHCALDDLIPFCEYFAIFYVFWYALVFFSLAYFLFYDVDSFKRLQIFIIITQVVAMAIYILFPSRQDMRPEVFANPNALTRLMAGLYSIDTNTGVCPSLHVAYSLGIMSVWRKYKPAPAVFRGLIVIVCILICLATMFVKQHSALDVLAAVPVSLLAEMIVYGRDYWLPKLQPA